MPLAAAAGDTSASARRLQVEMWRRMAPSEKLRLVTAITITVQQLSLAGIRLRHPDASEHECLLRLAALKLGPEMACRVYPEVARLPGL